MSVAASNKIRRFDKTERVVHWTNATLFGILMITGASLKVDAFSTIVANRLIVRNIHVYSGLLLPIPILVALCLRSGAEFRRDISRFNRWTGDDRRWWSRRKRQTAQLGKFNPGQKLNAIFVAAVIPVMLATGSIMKWFKPFPDSWRTGATFVHDSTWLALIFVILGHIWIATRDQASMNSMLRGDVPESWARRECPRWWAEQVVPEGDSVANGGDVGAGAMRDIEAGA